MGENPAAEGGKSRELLLAVLPWPEADLEKEIKDIKEEFPEYDFHYISEKFTEKVAERGKLKVPEDLYQRANVLTTINWLPPSPSAAPNLELIQFLSAGINHVGKHPIYTDSDIALTTASGIHGPQIAEWVIMMYLIHNKNYNALYEGQKTKDWVQSRGMNVPDAVGRRVGILGYGSIGRQVARVAKAMGSDVIAYTASPRETPESRKDTGFIVPGTGDADGSIPSAWYSGLDKKGLHEFLKQKIDLLVLCVPLTKETTHFLGPEEFELLHKTNSDGTYIANISRGGIIDQAALIKALETKQIRGAALDVTDPEPLPKDDPLWTAPNVLITPHISGSSNMYAQRALQVLQVNLRRRRDGEKLINQVDRKRGY